MAMRRFYFPAPKKLGGRKKRIYLIITAVLLVLLAFFAALLLRSANDQRTKVYILKGRESYETGDYENALLYLRRANADEKDIEAQILMADCYEAMGNYPRALETLRKLNTADPVVSGRIQAIEQRKMQEVQKQIVTVGGAELEIGTQTATLDGLGLTDLDLHDLRVLYALDRLSLQNNQLTDITALSELKGLDELDLAGNHIRDIGPLTDLSGLRVLNLDGNPLENTESLTSLRYLTSVSLVDTGIDRETVQTLAQSLPNCAIRFGSSEEIQMQLAGDVFNIKTSELALCDRGLTDIDLLQNFSELKVLNLSGNEITDIRPLMGLSKLEILNIDNNLINDLRPLIGLPLLSKLEATNNLIQETTAVGSIEKLTDLNLSGNPVHDYSGLGRLKALKILNLTNTGITDADLQELYGLKSIYNIDLRDNAGLSDRAVGALKSALPGCAIMTSELVYEIDFSGHLVRSDEKKLVFPSGGISDLSGLSKMARLEELDLRDNEIVSLYPFEITPSSTTILKLNLSNNQILDVQSLYALSEIEELDLSGNQISTVASLRKLTTLRRLNLKGNPLSEEALNDLRGWMPDCEILF